MVEEVVEREGPLPKAMLESRPAVVEVEHRSREVVLDRGLVG